MAPLDARPIVYLTSGIFGYLYRFFPVGRALRAGGHRVVVVTPSGEAVQHSRADGFEARHLERQEAALAALPPSDWPRPWRAVAGRIPGVALGPRRAARLHWGSRSELLADTSELVGILSDLDPKLVLTEAEEHRDIRVVTSLGLDLLLFEDLYSTRPGPDVPFPSRSHHIPTGSRWSRMRATLGWQRFFAMERLRRQAERWWVGGHDWHTMLAGLGAGFGEGSIDRRYFQYYDYVGIPRIRTVLPDLAFPGEPQPPVIVGPIVDPDRGVHQADAGFEARWAVVRQRRQAGARVVYVSLGTFLSGLEDLTEQVIEAVQRVPGTEVVVSVGRDWERWHRVEWPENVAVFGRVPQTRVLAHTDVVVSTGGLNTGHEALWFGVPVLNLPVAGLDTPGNAARLAYHGVGRRLVPEQVSIEAVRREVVELLDEPVYRQRAARMGDRMRSMDGVAGATTTIEEHLAAR